MVSTASLVLHASLVADRSRATMLITLMDGRALTATELARAAGITAPTASAHLAMLVDAGALTVERQGRHRYHRLAGPAVAQMIESMMVMAAGVPDAAPRHARPPAPVTGPRDRALRLARTCYDHLAGSVAVRIADSLLANGHVLLASEGGEVTATGLAFLRDEVGLTLPAEPPSGRRQRLFCKPCLDWSERRPHLAGTVGAALLVACLTRGWARRCEGSRAVEITPTGQASIGRLFRLEPGWASDWATDRTRHPA